MIELIRKLCSAIVLVAEGAQLRAHVEMLRAERARLERQNGAAAEALRIRAAKLREGS